MKNCLKRKQLPVGMDYQPGLSLEPPVQTTRGPQPRWSAVSPWRWSCCLGSIPPGSLNHVHFLQEGFSSPSEVCSHLSFLQSPRLTSDRPPVQHSRAVLQFLDVLVSVLPGILPLAALAVYMLFQARVHQAFFFFISKQLLLTGGGFSSGARGREFTSTTKILGNQG